MMPPLPRQRLWARWGLDPAEGLLDGVLIECSMGRIARIEPSRTPPADVPEDCRWPNGFVTPGLLNAHAHLDYSWLGGRMPRRGFVDWVGAIVAARRALTDETGAQAREACVAAIDQAIAAGTTAIWDISSLGVARPLLETSGLASISFMEIIAPSRADWEANGRARLAQFKMASYISPPETSIALGVSPHTAYTVIPEALEACAHWANRRGVPMAIHLAESPEENELLIDGAGPLKDYFEDLTGKNPAEEFGVGASPIERAGRADALQPHCLAVHCNLPQPGEAQLLARSEVPVVFCPLSHAWFDYPPYPLEEYRRLGMRMALGTDSLASNRQLDIRMEAAEIARRYRPNDPLWILGLATGAALGSLPPYGGRGTLAELQRANWAVWEAPGLPRRPTIDNMIDCWLDPSTRCAQTSITCSNALPS